MLLMIRVYANESIHFFSYDLESSRATNRVNGREMRGKTQTPVFPRATHHDIEIKHEFSEKMSSSSRLSLID